MGAALPLSNDGSTWKCKRRSSSLNSRLVSRTQCTFSETTQSAMGSQPRQNSTNTTV